MSEANAQGRSLSVAVVDPDRLFNVNRENGWQSGDKWLIEFADLARQCVRATDVIARYSGGEFAVLMPDTDAPSAQTILLGLCHAVSATVCRGTNGEPFTVTVSVGIAQLQPKTVGVEDLMRQANVARYDAKQCGGNCVKVENQLHG